MRLQTVQPAQPAFRRVDRHSLVRHRPKHHCSPVPLQTAEALHSAEIRQSAEGRHWRGDLRSAAALHWPADQR